ncbi:MAG: hypothetical protein F4011_11390, partial [Acidimicrobiaceae bacterium]|nr:hypothetical protein [Acidimicrobiaceae bacterium]
MGATARPITADQLDQVIDACPAGPRGVRDAAMLLVMREAALAPSTVATLRWEDLTTNADGITTIAGQLPALSGRCVEMLEAWRNAAGELPVRTGPPTMFGVAIRSVLNIVKTAGARAG